MSSALSARLKDVATSPQAVSRAVALGSLSGMAASMVMAGYAMIASATYQHHGFYTPLYHIASTLVAPTELMTSMSHAMMGDTFHFALGTAALGALIHMMTGAMYGAMFGALVVLKPAGRTMLPLVGAVWGAVVFAVSSYVGLPLAAAIFDSGDQISDMAEMVGRGTFLVEHLLFGLALGALMAVRPARR